MTRKTIGVSVGCGLATIFTLVALFLKAYIFPISQDQYEMARSANQTLVTTDTVYESPDGFSILIPAGYKYSAIESGPFTVFASKPPCNLEGTKHRWRFGNLGKMFAVSIDGLQKQYNNISFNTPVDIELGSVKGIRADYIMTFPDGVVHGIFIWFKINSTLYQFVFTCPEHFIESYSFEYERMLGSLIVK